MEKKDFGKIAFLGCGNMGKAVLKGISRITDTKNISVTAKHFENAKALESKFKVKAFATNREAVSGAKYIFLCVKPNSIKEVLGEICGVLEKNSVIISMAAGVSIKEIEDFVPDAIYSSGVSVLRMMPNMPVAEGLGMTALSGGKSFPEEDLKTVKSMLETTGIVEIVPENLMDCVTAVSGSAPAFIFMIIEAMADGAVKCGMARSQAYTYAAQTVFGAAGMVLKTKEHPAVLKDKICSPAGTTIEGVAVLEESGLRSSIIKAVTASYEKSKKMREKK